jgi:putative pyruvate formate lyase activating enzyme
VLRPSESQLRACMLCPRRCGVDREAGERGFCGAGRDVVVYRHGPHHGEEPPISGTRGSGTVFFSHCTLACLYCQNYPWSQEGQGDTLGPDALAEVFTGLAQQGCHNWNLVSPTPWLPQVARALATAKGHGHDLPIVYNTSGFEDLEALADVADWVDIFLADLRYATRETAREASRAASYVEAARRALLDMWQRVGPLQLDADGIATRGMICRILVLPGRSEEAVQNLQWLAEHVGTGLALSVMSQYVPAYRAASGECPGWDRPVTRDEYERVCETAERLGFDEGWMQEYEGDVAPELLGYQMEAGGPAATRSPGLT